MSETALSAIQRRILDYIVSHTERRGSFPSGPQIGRQLEVHPSSVYYQLDRLIDLGYLTFQKDGGWRRFQLTDKALARSSDSFPVLGRIPAGPLLDIEEHTESVVRGLTDLVPSAKEGDFLVEVDGDSMIEAGLESGMMALARPDMTASPGDICAVWIDGEGGTLKRVYPTREAVRLVPANAAYQEQRFPHDRVRIQGVVVAAIKISTF